MLLHIKTGCELLAFLFVSQQPVSKRDARKGSGELGAAGLAPGSAVAPVAADGRGAVSLYLRGGKG